MKKLIVLLVIITQSFFGFRADAAIELYYYTLFSDANLKGYWRLEGNSNDSKNTNNGTDTNITYSSVTKMFGQAAYFNGSGYIEVPNNATLNFTTAFSVFCWIKTGTSDVRFVQKWDGANGWVLYSNGNLLNFYARINSTYKTGTGAVFTDNNWHLIGMTYDGANIKLWFDGAQSGSSVAATGNVNNTTGTVLFGVAEGKNNSFMNGYMDDISIFNRALTSTEIADYYNASGGATAKKRIIIIQ